MFSPATYRRLVSGEWQGWFPGMLRRGLGLLAPVYGWGVKYKNWRFDSGRALPAKVAAPVISVGNLTVGGTGKTPLVCWLAQHLAQQGAEIALISRGYGARSGQANDEALELAFRLPGIPHFQNKNRLVAANAALANLPDTKRPILILDDAFQHRRMARDLEIVVLDALQPFGYNHLLPRGLLREPKQSLSRAHCVVLSRADAITPQQRAELQAEVAQLAPDAVWVETITRPASLLSSEGNRLSLNQLTQQLPFAFCGIGNPAGFRHTLTAAGIVPVGWREFPDHHHYSASDLAQLAASARQQGATSLLCTHKDLVKLTAFDLSGLPLHAILMNLEITVGKTPFLHLLSQVSHLASHSILHQTG